ncbi:hypothetical protein ACTXT7_009975 [Hymenolepis weldensis]
MSKRAYRFPLFYNSLDSLNTTHACQLPAPKFPLISTVPQPLPPLLLSSILVVASLNTFWSNQLLVFCSTIAVNSNSSSYEL